MLTSSLRNGPSVRQQLSPQLHTHVTARWRDDVAPGGPLPAGPNVDRPEDEWLADVSALRALLAAGS